MRSAASHAISSTRAPRTCLRIPSRGARLPLPYALQAAAAKHRAPLSALRRRRAEPAEQRPSVLSFTYTDVEGDLVAVASDADLRMAVRLFRLDAAAPFLKLAVDETAAPTAAPATQKAAAAGRGGRAKQPAATQHKSAPPEPTVEELEGEEEDEAGDVAD